MREVAKDTLIDGRYRILHRVGSGGMADVYCAEDTQLGRRVALKLLHQRFADDHEFVERFRREASSAAGLSHQHVVGVFDRGAWDGTYYIAMEYLDGRSLKQVIVDEAPLDPARAIDIAIQILRAARFAHKRGVIHRDLKPHNVILDSEGRAKVTDFGIARAGASDMTETGSIMGTAQYLSPEQAQGHAVSAASDIYAIGIVLYELLTGQVPFDGESAVTIALKQVSEAPVPPSAYNGAVTPELEAAVLRALEKDPAARFADAEEFIAALEDAKARIGGDPRGEGGDTAELGVVPPVRQLPPDATRVIPVPSSSVYPEPLSPVVHDERTSGRGWGLAVLLILVLAAAGVGAYLLTRPEKVIVPNVVNKPALGASGLLRNAGFVVHIETVPSPTAKNLVISQDPPPREKADKGSTVNLTVSGGPGTTSVPIVDGKGRALAARTLRKAGFKVDFEEQSSDTVAKNHVIEARPPGGSEAEIGRRITLVVSTGKEKVMVPGVVGKDITEATRTLEDAGFVVVPHDQVTDKKTPGTVLKQDPTGGAQADKGATVQLTVAKASDLVEVPGVVGLSEADAQSNIEDLGLTPVVRDASVSSQDQDGVVVSQNPPPRSKRKKGSRVIIRVGRFQQPPTDTTTTPFP
ncbi:MAG: eukaryotic-like serine/threonine-protein kinase [Solirubrobacteraceae bacterium]|nr:eukaryotic-like serine/threonine-protein kinase [Solirubrobacteraceae bacterium]